MYFTVETCSSVVEMHVAPILESPVNGSQDIPRSPSFSWTGFSDTTKYEFILAKDANLTLVVLREEVPSSAYHHAGKLDYGQAYFWQVKALEPVPSEPGIGTFTVVLESPVAPPPSASATPYWIWVIIGILVLLNVVIIMLCITKR